MKPIFDGVDFGGIEAEPILPQTNERTCECCLNENANGVVHIWQENTIWFCPERFRCDKVSEFRDKYVRLLKERSEMPKELLEKTGKGFITDKAWQRKAVHVVANWVEDEGRRWLVILGEPGSGKTHLASAAANFAMSQGKRVFFCRWGRVMNDLKTYKGLDTPLYHKCEDVPVLFLDDLYKGNPTEFEIKATAELIDYRYANNLPTIITSEKYPDELMEIDTATLGRMFERCGDCWFEMPRGRENDYRMQRVLSHANF